MALVLQVVVTGLAAGATYGLVAIGYGLIYRLTGVVHFALGELVGLSVFATLFFAAGTGLVTRTNLGAGRFLISLTAGVGTAVVTGTAVYLAAVRPFLRRTSVAGWIGATVGVAFAVRGFLAATFIRQSYVLPDPLHFERLGRDGVLELGGGVTVQIRTFFVIAVGILLAAGAAWILGRTDTGRGLQAIASDTTGARTVGLPVDRLLAFAFALAGGLAAVSAVAGLAGGPVTVDTGSLLGLKGLVAALLAGFGSPWKAFAAGLTLGVVETGVASFHLGGVMLGPAYRDVLPLAIAILALAFRRLGGPAPDE